MQETWVWSLGWEDPLEKGMASHSSILAWKIPWTEEPGGLQSMGRRESDMIEWLTHTHTPVRVCLEVQAQPSEVNKNGCTPSSHCWMSLPDSKYRTEGTEAWAKSHSFVHLNHWVPPPHSKLLGSWEDGSLTFSLQFLHEKYSLSDSSPDLTLPPVVLGGRSLK